mmetsp:Transcript_104458/g.204884  ORF Transcript_104458/g.204884 Transcript_104458/m.204884 type:complete len:332 (+) Transcript_104458:89-1084(+)
MACFHCFDRVRSNRSSSNSAGIDTASETETISITEDSTDNEAKNDEPRHFEDNPEDREWDSMFFPQLARACCAADGEGVTDEEDLAVPVKSTRDARMTASFRLETELLPQPSRPPSDSSDLIIHEQQLRTVTVDQLREAIQKDDVIEGYLEQFAQAWDISITNWTNSPAGLRVRRAEFTMPVPQEVPAAIARLVAVPSASKATIVMGFVSTSPDELLVLLQQCTHDVPYGQAFRVQETMSFRTASGGGSTFSKWTSVRWIQDLPWIAKAIKPITESKTRAGSPAGGQAFIKVLQEAAGVDAPLNRCPTLKEVSASASARIAEPPAAPLRGL